MTNTNSTIPERFAQFIIHYPLWSFVISLCIALPLLFGVNKVGFTGDYRVFFDKTNDQLVSYERLQKLYSKNESVFFTIKWKQGNVLDKRALELIEKVTKDAWLIPNSIRVDSLTNYQHTFAEINDSEEGVEYPEDNIIVRDLFDSSRNDNDFNSIEKIAKTEPTLIKRLVSSDLSAAGVLVTLHLPEDNPMAVFQSVGAAESIKATIKSEHPEVDVAITGIAPISAAYPKASMYDLTHLIPAMFVILFVGVIVFLRSITATLICMMTVFVSAACAFGFAGFMGIKLTPPTTMVPIIVLSVAVADSIHILAGALDRMREGLSKREALFASLSKNFIPVSFTSITTIIGFLALNFAASPPYREMGNMASVGVLIAWGLSLFLVPSLMLAIPRALFGRTKSVYRTGYLDRCLQLLVQSSGTHSKSIVKVTVILTCCMLTFAPYLEVDDRILENFDESMQIRKDSEFTLDNLTGIYQVEFSVYSGSNNGITEPKYIDNLNKFVEWLRQQPEVVSATGLTDTLKRMNYALHQNDSDYFRIPDTKTLTAQLILLYEYSLPYGLSLVDTVDINKSSSRVIATLGPLTTQQIIEVSERASGWLKTHNMISPQVPEPSGVSVMFSYLSHHNITSMIYGTVLGLFFIVIAMFIFLKSFRLGLISLVPNLLPLAIVFGLWGMVFQDIGTPESMVIVVVLGLVVDATVHILYRCKENIQEGLSIDEAMNKSLLACGKPILISGLVLSAGFGVLAFSSYKLNADLGLMCTAIFLVALAVDLLFLPAMLKLMARFVFSETYKTNIARG